MPEPYRGERIRLVRQPDGTTHAELTPEYAAWWAERIHRAEVDEATVEQWVMGGMVGRLVRYGDGPVEVEPCDPADDGEFGIREYREGKGDG